VNDVDLERLAARADLSRLLAACYYQPCPEFVEERLFDSLAHAAAVVDSALAEQAQRLGSAFADVDLQSLLVDYTRLFLGPGSALAHPYESVWLRGQAQASADPTPGIVHLYREAGFDIAGDFHDLPDHIAAELEFLYMLLFRETGARARCDAGAARGALAMRRRLIGEHLGRWIEPFAAAVDRGAQCAFYRTLAALTRRHLALEARAAALT
jgi:TorA maturation chaperone TorD